MGAVKGIRRLLCALPLAITGGIAVSAAGLSPATGETFNPLPYILGGIGLLAVIALVVLTVLEQKKKNGGGPPTPPTDKTDDDDLSAL